MLEEQAVIVDARERDRVPDLLQRSLLVRPEPRACYRGDVSEVLERGDLDAVAGPFDERDRSWS